MTDLLVRRGPGAKLGDAVRRVRQRARDAYVAIRDAKEVEDSHRRIESAYLDSRIKYPCYKSFDEFIDVERLRSLHAPLMERLAPRTKDGKFWAGPWVVEALADQHPGSKVVDLMRNKSPEPNYYHQNQPELWEPSEDAAKFPEVMDFVATLPFKGVGRVMIMYDFHGKAVTAHRDHDQTDIRHEFIWFRTELNKPFYMMNKHTGERKYVEGHSAWFDTVNQFHGVDPVEGFAVSFRVDGIFSDELRARIPVPADNAASTAALWACTGDRTD